MSATSRPWHYEEIGRGFNWLVGPKDKTVFHVGPVDRSGNEWLTPADARLIVSAVNAHDLALRLAEAVLEWHRYRTADKGGPCDCEACKLATEFISIAKGK